MSIFQVQGAEGSAGWPQDRRGAGEEGRGGLFSWGVDKFRIVLFLALTHFCMDLHINFIETSYFTT